ncbi:hypothetical protein SAMN04489812_2734 [Microlunatus soli]|uniref:Uncharacterized protein n=2 Tax=Microlunatus soli TaxID=630515 RepID=A0A1H1UD16_9ACTN|nr:hypothetical protein SAMN04489812_2734 [Microlunatus soli]
MVDREPSGTRSTSSMTDEMTPRSAAEGRSLDRVQRVLVSLLITVVVGIHAASLAVYVTFNRAEMARSDVIGLWAMTGLTGLASAVMILMINRRKPYNPLVLLGLLPLAASGLSIFL